MRSGRFRELLAAIQREDWTEVITIAKAAAERASNMHGDAPRYPLPEEREHCFDLDQADYIQSMHQVVLL
jgi:hypothetical protein